MQRMQTAILTRVNREPRVMRNIRHILSQAGLLDGKKILSFGCSIGDEIATLKGYFPTCDIYGCDIDEDTLAAARSSVGHLATVFPSTANELQRHGPFDVICAFSVLCLSPAPKDFAEKFTFSQFEDGVGQLDRALAPGGILALVNTSYLFNVTSFRDSYVTYRDPYSLRCGTGEIFAKDGSPMIRRKSIKSRMFYQLLSTVDISDEHSVSDNIFVKASADSGPRLREFKEEPLDANAYEVMFSWERSNLDGLDDPLVGSFVEYRQNLSFARDRQSGNTGHIVRIGRSRLLSPGLILTPPYFVALETDSMTGW
jgi:SAM-dependent methyltransferase